MPRSAKPLAPSQSTPESHRSRLRDWLASQKVQRFIIVVILINAAILGLDTSPTIKAAIGPWLVRADQLCLAIFIIELLLKIYAQGRGFLRRPWNIFDSIIVGIALIPGSGSLAVLRALRVLRVFRLVSAMPKLRFVVEALMRAIPGMLSIGALLAVVFYVSAVMAATLFGPTFPQWFGNLGDSLYTLFQIMTLESWSMGIVRPVMAEHWWAPAFFVPFILLSSFTVLNLFIAVIVDSMQTIHEAEEEQAEADKAEQANAQEAGSDREDHKTSGPGPELTAQELSAQVAALRADIADLKTLLADAQGGSR